MFSPIPRTSARFFTVPVSNLVIGLAAPRLYLPINSNELNINLGKGTTTVKPLLVIILDMSRNNQKSGALPYVTSSALYVACSINE